MSLDKTQVADIRQLHAEGVRPEVLCALFEISPTRVHQLVTNPPTEEELRFARRRQHDLERARTQGVFHYQGLVDESAERLWALLRDEDGTDALGLRPPGADEVEDHWRAHGWVPEHQRPRCGGDPPRDHGLPPFRDCGCTRELVSAHPD